MLYVLLELLGALCMFAPLAVANRWLVRTRLPRIALILMWNHDFLTQDLPPGRPQPQKFTRKDAAKAATAAAAKADVAAEGGEVAAQVPAAAAEEQVCMNSERCACYTACMYELGHLQACHDSGDACAAHHRRKSTPTSLLSRRTLLPG